MAAATVADDELGGLFSSIQGLNAVGLAVSGGPDSTALMHLYARWRQAAPAPRAMVLSVDHGLRPQSGSEAASVVTAASRLGLPCEVLRWEGDKPATGIQEAAREARRRLLVDAAVRHGLDAILTAHTEDDQAETILMRLARGSGLDGLAGIPERALHCGVEFVRPLLGVSKERLIATLEQASVPFAEDPTNGDLRFERARFRKVAPHLRELGLTAGALSLSARRLGRARQALEVITNRSACEAVEVSPLGNATLDLDHLKRMPPEIAVRLVQRMIGAVGGDEAPASLAKLEELADWLTRTQAGGRTLARTEIKTSSRRALFLRETGRDLPPEVALKPGGTVDWDGRFRISLREGIPEVRIVPGGSLCVRHRSELAAVARSPGFDAAPFVLRDTTILGTPFDAEPSAISGVFVTFLGLTAIFGRRSVRCETQK